KRRAMTVAARTRRAFCHQGKRRSKCGGAGSCQRAGRGWVVVGMGEGYRVWGLGSRIGWTGKAWVAEMRRVFRQANQRRRAETRVGNQRGNCNQRAPKVLRSNGCQAKPKKWNFVAR